MNRIEKEVLGRRNMSVIIFCIVQALSLISPYIMGQIVDIYLPAHDTDKIVFGIILFALIPFICVGLRTFYNYFTIKYVRKKGNEYSLQIMQNLLYKEMNYYDGEKTLEVLSYVSKEIVGYINFLVAEMSQFYVNIIISMFTLVLLININPIVGLLQLLYIPIAVFPTGRINRSVENEIQSVVKKNAEITQLRGDIFKAVSFIKTYRLEEKKTKEVETVNNKINSVWGKVAALDTLSEIWTSGFATVLFTGVSFGVAAIITVYTGKISVGQLVSLLSYCSILYFNINSLLTTAISSRKQKGEYKTVLSYLNLEGEREKNIGKKEYKLDNYITFKDFSFAYNDNEKVIDNLNLEIARGEWVGIIGRSGIGKTTILDALMGLYSVKPGMIYFDSTDITDMDVFDIRDNITKISQDITLFPGTIRDNMILINSNATGEEINEALEFACLSDFVAELPSGIDTDIGESGKLLSGGERQRLSIAMGILRGKKVLLLDEVTSNLDPETADKITEHFHQLIKKGTTIIAVSHNADSLKYADRIYKIDEK